MLNDKTSKYQITGALCLGEFGKIQDLSQQKDIHERIYALIASDQEEVRTASSIALGKMSIGNTTFFVPKVMASIQEPKTKHRYLYLNTIREIILNNSKALEHDVATLTDQLLVLASHKEDRICALVAECIGRLYQVYAFDMNDQIAEGLYEGKLQKKVATVCRSFMYSGQKIGADMIEDAYKENAEILVKLIVRNDAEVKRYTIEGLLAIVKSNWHLVQPLLKDLIPALFNELSIREEFITIYKLPSGDDLKIDAGQPIRTASYNTLTQLIDCGAAEPSVALQLMDFIAEKGLKETNDDIFKLLLQIVGVLARKATIAVLSRLDKLLEVLNQKFDFFSKNLQSEVIESKLLAMFRAVFWINEQNQNEDKPNEKFEAFIIKISCHEKTAGHFDRVKQQMKKNF